MLEYGWMGLGDRRYRHTGQPAFFLKQMREAGIIADPFYLREDQSNGRFC